MPLWMKRVMSPSVAGQICSILNEENQGERFEYYSVKEC
jgi:hypothetical protein